jgi:diguanylate cyclase (GGDEF)-like protein/PAS domain S-box-containing protein
MKRLATAFACLVLMWMGALAAQPADPNLGATAEVIELKGNLKPYTAPDAGPKEKGSWYSFAAVNLDNRPATRVLQAGQPPRGGLHLLPPSQRPTILRVVSLTPGVQVVSTNAYGRKSYVLTLPPSSKVSVAVRMVGLDDPPSLLAWTDTGATKHKTQMAIFIAAVAGLVAAAAVIAAGLGVMTHHWAPRWAAAALISMLMARLGAIGMFDGSIVTSVGGPYGLTAAFGGLALAASIRFVDLVVPLHEVFPLMARYLRHAVIAVLILSGLAYIGAPVATVLMNVVLFATPLAIFAYLVHRDRLGSRPARVLQPAAGLFAMSSIATAFAALGGFGSASIVPDLAGGFVAAGAIMLALAVTAGEGITVVPWRHHPAAPAPVPAPPPQVKVVVKEVVKEVVRDADVPHAALEAIDASRQGVFELDLINDFAILSLEAGSLIGLGEGRLSHYRWIELIHPDDRGVYEQAVGEFRKQSGLAFRIEFRVQAEDGRYLWLELRATMKGPDGDAAERCVGLLADVTTRKEAEVAALDRSLGDPLTGLGNRVALVEELEGLGTQLRQAMFAVLDVDRFKAIHASLGDAGGDEVLLQIADRLRRRYDGFAQIFRTGGDGFAVLLPHPADKPEAVGAGLVQLCSAAHVCDGRSVFAPVSVGVALGREAKNSIDLMKNAELALARAKRDGGDCSRVFTLDMETNAPADPVALEADLRRALSEGEIEVFYQPIIRLADRTVAGFEALLRWRHPTKGMIEPANFIAHSEETGIIIGLGRLALDRAAADLAEWQRYFPLPEPLFVSVNLSRRQLRDGELMHRLQHVIAETGLAPGSFKLEMTESTIATDADARALAGRIRELGAGLAIDDFGTGMSSLSQFADLPFDTVKIDKSFLSGTTESSSVVLASIVSLTHELKRAVIIEGVETEADAARVAELGCEYAQGFLFSGAVNARDAMTIIAKGFRQ